MTGQTNAMGNNILNAEQWLTRSLYNERRIDLSKQAIVQ